MNATRAKPTLLDFRPMKRGDLAEIVEIEKLCFPDPWPKSAFEDIISARGHGALVAVLDKEIIAYGCYLVISPEAHLTNLAVRPDFRRKAVATEILNQILDITSSKKCEYIILEVRPRNESAIAFYENAGFKLLYRRPRYYRNPVEDALVMVYYFNETTS